MTGFRSRDRDRMARLVARYCREEPMTPQERHEVERHLMGEEEETIVLPADWPGKAALIEVEPPRPMPRGPRCQRN
jgi:hypothetical protein